MSFQGTLLKLLLKLPDNWKVKLAGGTPLEIAGRTLDPDFQLFGHFAAKRPGLASMDPVSAQAAAIEGFAQIAGKPEPGVSWSDIALPSRRSHNIPARLYLPDAPDPEAPMMVYAHMGGGVIGNLETCHDFCQLICAIVKCPVLSVDYKLAPQYKFPAGLEDCLDAYEWALKNAGKYHAPPGRAAIGGDSMGGQFAAIIAQEMKREEKPLPDLQILIYPPTDVSSEFPSYDLFSDIPPLTKTTSDWFRQQYLPEGADVEDVRISPALEARLEGLPPAIVATAGFDILIDDGAAYCQKLEQAGVKVRYRRFDTLAHGFTAFMAVVPAARTACTEIAHMIREAYQTL